MDDEMKNFVAMMNKRVSRELFDAAFAELTKTVLEISKKLTQKVESLYVSFDAVKKECLASVADAKAQVSAEARATIDRSTATFYARLDERMNVAEAAVEEHKAGKTEMLSYVKSLVPTVDDVLKQLPSAGRFFRDGLELLSGKERLNKSAIAGIEDIERAIRDLEEKASQPPKVEIRGGGGTRGFYVYVGGVKKGIINTLDFVAGTGMSIAYSKVNGRDTITFNATGGGITVETPAEAPDASRTTFTVSSQPKWIVADGTTYYENQGYTYAAGVVTMGIPPSSFIRAIL